MRVSKIVRTALGALLLLAPGCTAPTVDWVDHPTSLDFAQRRYTQLVRWGELERSGEYVDTALRPAYLLSAPSLRDVRFTDYDVVSFEMDESQQSAKVTVEFKGYNLSSMLERTARVDQEWYREGEGTRWFIRPSLDALRDAFVATAP